MYYWINGSTFVGPEVDNQKYPDVKPETWDDYFGSHTLEELQNAFSALSSRQ